MLLLLNLKRSLCADVHCGPSEGPGARRGSAWPSAAAAERDLTCVPVSHRAGDRAGHRHAHHGDLPDHARHTGEKSRSPETHSSDHEDSKTITDTQEK